MIESWIPPAIITACVSVFGTFCFNRIAKSRDLKKLKKTLSGALAAEISLAFDSYADYEFPKELVDRRFEKQIRDVVLFNPPMSVYQKNTDKIIIFHPDDTKKLVAFYVQIETLSRLVQLLDRRVEEYKETIRKSNNLPLNMNQNLPVPYDKIRQTMADIQSCKETAFQLRQDVLDMLKKYQA